MVAVVQLRSVSVRCSSKAWRTEATVSGSMPFSVQAWRRGFLPPQQKSILKDSKTRARLGRSATSWPTVRSRTLEERGEVSWRVMVFLAFGLKFCVVGGGLTTEDTEEHREHGEEFFAADERG